MNRIALRDLMIVLGVAVVLRTLAVLTLPLIVTNDGAFYLLWGSEIASGQRPDLPATRTPGYPIFLGIVFAVLSQSAAGVVVAQHALSAFCAASGWFIGFRIAGREIGLAAGVLIALDPWLLGLSSYALSETLSVAFVLTAMALAVGWSRLWTLAIAGVCLGCAILVRPASMAWIPGLVLIAASLPTPHLRTRGIRAGVVVIGAAVAVGPWFSFNISRGTPGLAQTDGLALWGGLARAGLLDPDHELPPRAEAPPRALFEPHPSERVLLQYFRRLGTIDGLDRAQLANDWTRASIAGNPFGYSKAVIHAAAWQSNAMLPGTPYRHDGLLWTMRRLGGIDAPAQGPSNLSTGHLPDFLKRFEDEPSRGPLAWLYRHWPLGMFQCFPQLPLAVLTVAALGPLLWQRRWTAAAVLAASFPIVIGHALLLQPFARYSISAWMVWWLGGGMAVQIAWPHAIRLVRHSLPQRGAVDR